MKNAFLVATLALAATTALSGAQQQAQPPAAPPASQSPVAPQPKPKSQAEVTALQAVFNAPDVDTRIKAADEFVGKFADSEFKGLVLMVEAESYRQKNDYEKTIIYGERTLEADPQNFMSMIMLAATIAQRTREFDLDREEKLARVEKYANQAMELLKSAPRPRQDISDEQWNAAKADFSAQAHEALAMAAMARKKYDVAISEFNTALQTGSSPDPATMVRLGAVYNMAGKPDDAIGILGKVMALPDCTAGPQPGCAAVQIKQFAQAERARAMQAKGGGAKPPAAPPAASGAPAPAAPAAPPPAEPKKP